jgi:hypothetical protein
MNARPSQAALAELLSLNTAMVTQHAQMSATIAATQKLIAQLAVENLFPDAPPVPPVAATKAVAVNEGSEIATATAEPPLKRDKILDLWAAGMTKEAIAEATGSTPISVNTTVVTARRCNDPRAIRRSDTFEERRERILDLYARGNLPASIARELGTPLKGIETVLYRARKAGEPRAAKHKPTTINPGNEPAIADQIERDAYLTAQRDLATAANKTASAIVRAEPPKPVLMGSKIEPNVTKHPAPVAPVSKTAAIRALIGAPPVAKPVAPAPAIVKAPPPPAPDDDKIMIVGNDSVHGPRGVEDRLGPTQLMLCKRLSDGGMYPESVLGDAAGISNGTIAYMLAGMRPKLADIGVELFQPVKGYWTARRFGE